MSGNEEELQELSQQIQVIESQLEAVQREIQVLNARKNNLTDAIDAISTIDTGSTIQVPVGGGAYVRATVDSIDEIIVGIGGGYSTEGDDDEAVSILEDRKDRIDERVSDLNEAVAELETQGQQLSQEAQRRVQRLQQEQLQQQGGMGGGEFPG